MGGYEAGKARIGQGLCIYANCGEPLSKTSGYYCQSHKEKQDKRRKQIITERKANKVCTRGNCGKPVTKNSGLYCQYHRDFANERRTQRKLSRRMKGLCEYKNCDKQVAESTILCQEHLNQQRKRHKTYKISRKVQGLCEYRNCSNPIIEGQSITFCQYHLAYRNQLLHKSRASRRRIYGLYLHYYPRANSYKTGEGEIYNRVASARIYNPDVRVVGIIQLLDKTNRKRKHNEIKDYWGLDGCEVFYPEEYPNIIEEAHQLFDVVNFDGINLDEIVIKK